MSECGGFFFFFLVCFLFVFFGGGFVCLFVVVGCCFFFVVFFFGGGGRGEESADTICQLSLNLRYVIDDHIVISLSAMSIYYTDFLNININAKPTKK